MHSTLERNNELDLLAICINDPTCACRVYEEVGGENPMGDSFAKELFEYIAGRDFQSMFPEHDMKWRLQHLWKKFGEYIIDVSNRDISLLSEKDRINAVVEQHAKRDEKLRKDAVKEAAKGDNLELILKCFSDLEKSKERRAIDDDYADTLVDLNNIPEDAPKVFSLGGTLIAREGTLLVVEGQSKSGKSSILMALGASYVNPATKQDVLSFKCHKSEGVIEHIDTEQSYTHQNKLIKQLKFRSEVDAINDKMRFHNATGKDGPALMKILIKAARKREVFAVVVDGIADFIPDTNDLKESEALVKSLMGLVEMNKLVLVLVIHQNPGIGGKGRGHLGSVLDRKAATILQVKKDGETHTISTRQYRDAPIIGDDAIRCQWSDSHKCLVGRQTVKEAKEANKLEQQKRDLKEMRDGALKEGKRYSYTELLNQGMKEEWGGKTTIKQRIKEMKELRLLLHKDEEYWYN